MTHQGDVMSGEKDSDGAFQHLGHYRAGISAHSLNAFSVERRLDLAGVFIHEAHIPLFRCQDAWLIDLCITKPSSNNVAPQYLSEKVCQR